MSPPVKSFVQRWLITTVAVLIAAHVVNGIHYDDLISLVVASLILGILNAFLRPIMLILSLPLLLVTLGLFTLVINAMLLYFVGWLMKSFHVESFWSAFWGALIISIVSMVCNAMLGTSKARVEVNRTAPRSRRGPDGTGQGPIIDV
ncbi:MAG: phage holin family protein [Verrucomicrobiota bacterium]